MGRVFAMQHGVVDEWHAPSVDPARRLKACLKTFGGLDGQSNDNSIECAFIEQPVRVPARRCFYKELSIASVQISSEEFLFFLLSIPGDIAMRTIRHGSWFVCIVLLLVLDANARPLDLAFSNGVLTRSDEAVAHAKLARDRLVTLGAPELSIDMILLYHHDKYSNLEEVFIQKARERDRTESTIKPEAEALFSIYLARAYEKRKLLEEQMLYRSQGPIQEILDHMPTSEAIGVQNAADKTDLTRSLRNGHDVLIVAHSQGTLYANTAVDRTVKTLRDEHISLDGRLAVVGLGVAAGWIATETGGTDKTSYVTNKKDRVIDGLDWMIRKMNKVRSEPIPRPLSGNITVPFGLAWSDTPLLEAIAGHGFETIYLNKKFPTNQRFTDVTTCALHMRACNKDALSRASGANVPAAASETKPNVDRFMRHESINTQAVADALQPDKKSHSNDVTAIEPLAKRYPGPLHDAIVSWAWAKITFWYKARGQEIRSDWLKQLAVEAFNKEVCVLAMLPESTLRPEADIPFLVEFQSTLIDSPFRFADYNHADTLLSGQQFKVIGDGAKACEISKLKYVPPSVAAGIAR
ncbi:putative uncharacterized protein [Caballeronia insecticola]|uniref:Caspase family p10 domain-containing protein n=1 Tax=Caballeronia insecticola TaxID=758793 RepID=R4X0W8_9BURK|nr:putative uncharacterized protein [Caballeronia insecticola]